MGSCGRRIKVPSDENTELKVLPLKPGVGQYIAMHATLTAGNFFLASHLTVHSPSFFQNLSQVFPVSAAVNNGFCDAGSRVEYPRDIASLKKNMTCDMMTCEMNNLEIE